MNQTIRVGTRGSALALKQTEMIIAMMQSIFPDKQFEIVEIVTHGDRFQNKPITEMGDHVDRGIFNTALEEAVLDNRVDLATCSFKDVESDLPAGLTAVSVGPRERVHDVLVSRHRTGLAGLPNGATLATSSPRRTSQLLAFRPDLRFKPLRGNVPTRVEKESLNYDGVVLAAAGLLRLGLNAHISEFLDESIVLPAPAQGAMGCQYLTHREDIATVVAAIQHQETELCVRAEKALLVELSGGCFAPIGVLGQVQNGQLTLNCRVVSMNADKKVEDSVAGPVNSAEALVAELATSVRKAGGAEIIEETRQALQPKGN